MFKRRTVFVMTIIIALYLGVISGKNSAIAAKLLKPDKHVTSKSFKDWKYDVTEVGNTVYINVSSPIEATLPQQAKLKLRVLIDQAEQELVAQANDSKEFPAIVVFEDELGVDDLSNFSAQYSLNIDSYTILAIDERGEIVTIIGTPINGQVFPKDMFAKVLAQAEDAQQSKLTVKGIASIKSTLNKRQMDSIKRNAKVFGVDVTPALAVRDFKNSGFAQQYEQIEVVPASFYWLLPRK